MHTHAGVQLKLCDEILRQHSKNRLNAKEKLETSILILKVKFQASVERLRQRVDKAAIITKKLHSMRKEVEMHFLL